MNKPPAHGLLVLLLLFILPATEAAAGWQRQEAAIMGTNVTVELWHEDASRGRALGEAVMDEMRRIDDLMSSYKSASELAQLNAGAAQGPLKVSAELLSLINRALDYSRITGGAFDITYASAGQYYDYRTGKRPGREQLERLLPAIDYHLVLTDRQQGTVEFLQPGVRIDLGGIAKGYAVDRCMWILQQAGVENALVSAGGDTRIIGKRWERPWYVGIRDPRDREGLVSMLPLENTAISTSGDYERFFEENGVRYHHILDPATGESAHEVRSASVIGSLATDTDALSTSVFVLGVEKGLQLIDTLPGTEAVIVDNQGRLHYSAGLARLE